MTRGGLRKTLCRKLRADLSFSRMGVGRVGGGVGTGKGTGKSMRTLFSKLNYSERTLQTNLLDDRLKSLSSLN